MADGMLRVTVLTVAKPSVPSVATTSFPTPSVPTLTRVITIRGRDHYLAVASTDDEVFMRRIHGRRVDVFDAVTYTLRRHITVPELGATEFGMIACSVNRCLYLSHHLDSKVFRVRLAGGSAVRKWSVARSPRGLSINNAGNLVVACGTAKKLQEYTTHGCLVREICLQAVEISPWHAIQLSSGHYAVSNLWSPRVITVVGDDGQVARRYGQSQRSDIGKIMRPTSLAVTKNDDIVYAEQHSGKIMLIKTSTGGVQELDLPVEVDGGLRRPHCLCLDESRERLCVVECDELRHRVLVFGGVRL